MRNPFRYLFGRRPAPVNDSVWDRIDRITSLPTTPLRDRIMDLYNLRGLAGYTADEVAELLDVGVLTVRPRITELFQAGKLRRTGTKRANRSGLKANVMVSTRIPSAHAAAA